MYNRPIFQQGLKRAVCCPIFSELRDFFQQLKMNPPKAEIEYKLRVPRYAIKFI